MCIWTDPWRKHDDIDYFGPVINLVFGDLCLDKIGMQRSEVSFLSEKLISISYTIGHDSTH
jgi:hypothetical protein